MLIAFLFTSMAVTTAIDVNWSPTLNTLLLIVLAIITGRNARDARRTEERTRQVVKQTTDIQQKITGSNRDPNARTREDDEV